MEILDENSPEFCNIFQSLQRIETRLKNIVIEKLGKQWLTSKAVCEELGISKSTLARFRNELGLAHSRIGDKVFYERSKLEAFLKTYEVKGF